MFIKVLDSSLANRIAAGEVVERPASAVKELCENSIDAGASSITVEITGGGMKSIRVTDNGCGMHPDDVETAFLRHATSKITSAKDLDAIYTLGFRGEALASIAAVSKVEILTATEGQSMGVRCRLEAGKVIYKEEAGSAVGTAITISQLFYNTPARMKFLKRDYTEAGYVEEVVRKLAFSHPEVSFRFLSEKKEKLFTPGDGSLEYVAYAVYGKDVQKELLEVDYQDMGIAVSGLIGNNALYRKNRAYQTFYVNGRCIVNRSITAALEEGYKELLHGGTYPVAILKISLNPAAVDVNVHPAKLEVKFSDEAKVYQVVYWAVKSALTQKTIPKILEKDPGIEYRVDPPDYTLLRELQAKQQVKTAPEAEAEQREAAQEREGAPRPPAGEAAFEPAAPRDVETALDLPQQAPEGEKEVSAPSGKEAEEPRPASTKKPQYQQTAVDIGGMQNYRVVGQIFETYLIVEKDREMILIDQHAAHERIVYEQLLRQRENHKIYPQVLLAPVVVTLSPTEHAFVKEHLEFFQELGFEIEDFGNHDVMVRALPQPTDSGEIPQMLTEIITNAMQGKQDVTPYDQERALYSVACRAAVKAGQKLSQAEMEHLAKDILESRTKATCPHGRPVSIMMDQAFLEKLFKRTN